MAGVHLRTYSENVEALNRIRKLSSWVAGLLSIQAAFTLVTAAGMTGLTSVSGLPECVLLRCRDETSLG